jgi:hypothetical protein
MPSSEVTSALAIRDAEAEVVRRREKLVTSLLALRSELRRETDWRTWYRRAPVACVGVVFALGFIFAGRRPRHP